MGRPLDRESLDTLFVRARTVPKWTNKPVPETLLCRLFELTILGPTSGNSCPSRLLFVTSAAGKKRILPHVSEGNLAATKTAPVTVIVATDTRFWLEMHPEAKLRKTFMTMGPAAQEHGFRNGTLQGAYLIMAARALGLDCGAMSGFDNAGIDAEFFPDGRLRSNFLCNLGYGDHSDTGTRPPRPAFEAQCRIL